MRINVNEYIVVDSDICHGKPTFKGTRVMVWQVLEMLAYGSTVKEIIEAFPSITPDAVKASLKYAAGLASGRDNVILPLPSRA
jgi:uncharacterized protein (DUF433 family)